MSSARALAALLLALTLCSPGTVDCSNLVDILKQDGQFSILYNALEKSEELDEVEGRPTVNGTSFVLFAPTDTGFAEEFHPDIRACLQASAPAKRIVVQLLRYMQVTTQNTPVENAMDLLKQAQDNKIWTVLGQVVVVAGGTNNSVTLKSVSGVSQAVATEFRLLDVNVTLIPLASGIVIAHNLSDQIVAACLPASSSAAPNSPSVHKLNSNPKSGSRPAPASAPVKKPVTPASAPASRPVNSGMAALPSAANDIKSSITSPLPSQSQSAQASQHLPTKFSQVNAACTAPRCSDEVPVTCSRDLVSGGNSAAALLAGWPHSPYIPSGKMGETSTVQKNMSLGSEEKNRIKGILADCYNEGLLPEDLLPERVEVGDDFVRVMVNPNHYAVQEEWLKENALTVAFGHDAKSIPVSVKIRLIRMHEDGWAKGGSISAAPKRGVFHNEGFNLVTYVASAKEIAMWLLRKKEDKIVLDGKTYTMTFRPWMSEDELFEWREAMRYKFFWVRCKYVPVAALPYLATAVQSAFGKILKKFETYADPIAPELVNVRFDLEPAARVRYRPYLIIDMKKGGFVEIEVVHAQTPWCKVCRQNFHHEDDDCCPARQQGNLQEKGKKVGDGSLTEEEKSDRVQDDWETQKESISKGGNKGRRKDKRKGEDGQAATQGDLENQPKDVDMDEEDKGSLGGNRDEEKEGTQSKGKQGKEVKKRKVPKKKKKIASKRTKEPRVRKEWRPNTLQKTSEEQGIVEEEKPSQKQGSVEEEEKVMIIEKVENTPRKKGDERSVSEE
ncbi:hypothetical protein CBR_g29928 [Chara braunii]|uniref:FAS1 domain-containing protein n=1 Tax=Chara braunii TaxID=69332 RepID=A0A388JX00_CHABU|nr:hypothetical protein CBR_g29928 [Chara braunii]|eukprot:GBG62320.1 hypothetical protein CBR_g29928 [Chara braunii]